MASTGMRRAFTLLSCTIALGCTSAGHGALARQALRGELSAAIETYLADTPDDVTARRDLAVAVLMKAARSDEPNDRREAFSQLASLGPLAVDWLQDLVQEPGPEATKVEALGLLANMGDAAAVGALRELAARLDPELLPVAIAHVDATAERSHVLAWLEAPDAATRRAACRALRVLKGDRQVALKLIERLRLDPDASVRVQALQALVAIAADDEAAINEAMSDDDQRVRFAALSIRLAMGDEEAKAKLNALLHADASELAIEAARWCIMNNIQDALESAKGLLERALSASSPQIRAQTAVALRSLSHDVLVDVSLARLAEERDLNVRLQLALRHMPADAAKVALAQLRDSKVPMVGLEAAIILAQAGDKIALDRVLVARTAKDAHVRARAARALAGTLHLEDAVVALLADEDVVVRCAVARAFLVDGRPRSA